MRKSIFSIVGALFIFTTLAVTGCKQSSDPAPVVVAAAEGFSVIGSASGRVIGPDGIGINGVSVVYNTGSRAIKNNDHKCTRCIRSHRSYFWGL